MQDLRRDPHQQRNLTQLVLFLLVAATLFSCGGEERPTLRLAITTSTRDSGLMERLLPPFEAAHGCRSVVIAKGTGAALKLGAGGDVDAVMTHSPAAEERFMAEGHGALRLGFMESRFLIAGPKSDPASVRGLEASEALRTIRESESGFVSRGDDSGTHDRERLLWRLAGGFSSWDGYLESGRGMGATLTVADEKLAYLLVDIGTFARFRDKVDLEALVERGKGLENPYSVMVVHADRRPEGEATLARAFAQWLVGSEAQAIIRDYQIDGRNVFRATATKKNG